MQSKSLNAVTLFSIFFLAHWFFGNLYEQIVLVPNQLVNSFEALRCWQNYFTITNQIYYYVPFTQVSVFGIIFLYFKADDPAQKSLLKKASLFGVAALALTVLIVTQLNLKLFFGDLSLYKNQIFTLSVLWIIGNGVRLVLIARTLQLTCKVYLTSLSSGSNKKAQDKRERFINSGY